MRGEANFRDASGRRDKKEQGDKAVRTKKVFGYTK